MQAWRIEKLKADRERRARNRKPTPGQIHQLIMSKKRGRGKQRKLKGIKPGDGRDAA